MYAHRMHEIVMNGPAKNALGTKMMQFILDELRVAAGAPVLLTGAGDAFSAGLNLKEVVSLDETTGEPFLRLLENCMTTLYLYPAPTVAAINGHAIAGGCILALCCDHRVATSSSSAKVGINEVAIGLRFPPRVLAIARSRVPRRYRDRVLLGGTLFSPADAQEMGLVDELDADPLPLARERLRWLGAHPTVAYAQTKHDLRGATPQDVASDAAVDRWMRESIPSWTSSELKDHLTEFLRR
jgi:enoyl-CoA hydratase/carnithine racemase